MAPFRVFYKDHSRVLYNGDCHETLRLMEPETVDCFVSSPPYFGLRDYTEGHEKEVGQERHPVEYLVKLLDIYDEVRKVLKPTGTVFVNLGDKYRKGNKGAHCLPQRFLVGMLDRGWFCHNTIIWHKKSVPPYSGDRHFTPDCEPIYYFTKSPKFYFNVLKEPMSPESVKRLLRGVHQGPSKSQHYAGLSAENQNKYYDKQKAKLDNGEELDRQMRTLWELPPACNHTSHTATFPLELPLRCIGAGCPPGGTVCDHFMGSGTTALAAEKLNMKWIGIELEPTNCETIMETVRDCVTQRKIT
jgi:DNA modification methylase